MLQGFFYHEVMHIYFNFAQAEAQLQEKKTHLKKLLTNAWPRCQVVPIFSIRHMAQTGALSFSFFFLHVALSYTWKIKQTERKVAICPIDGEGPQGEPSLPGSRVGSHAAPRPHGGRGLQ